MGNFTFLVESVSTISYVLKDVWRGYLIMIRWETHKMQIFHLEYLLSPLCCTGTGSCWICWLPHSQLGPALGNLGRPAPSGDMARRWTLRTLLLADTQGQSLPGCLSLRITEGNVVSSGSGHDEKYVETRNVWTIPLLLLSLLMYCILRKSWWLKLGCVFVDVYASYLKTLSATTTGTPNRCAIWICFLRLLRQPPETRLRF